MFTHCCRQHALGFALGVITTLVALSFFRGQPPAEAQKADEPEEAGALAKLGPNAAIYKRLLPDDNPWNQPIDQEPVDANSATLIANIGANKPLHPDFGTVWQGAPNGIQYVVVSGDQPKVAVEFRYADESDPGPYPIPADAPIEGGPRSDGDRHVIVLDRDNWMLYELFSAYPAGKSWKAGAGAIFDLRSNKLRPAGWTSADAAGLPILPGLVRYGEAVQRKSIEHALRFTAPKTRRGYVAPATHFASTHTGADLPPMGTRVRLKSDFNVAGYPPECQVILKALQKYGMYLADNGGAWFVSGAPDPRWNVENLRALKKVKGRDFEVVKMGEIITR
jgi:hypothetical protein